MASSEENNTCKVCKESIPLTARKCSKCGSWQHPLLRIINLSSTVMALFVALISVMSIFYTFYRDSNHNSDLSALINKIQDEELYSRFPPPNLDQNYNPEGKPYFSLFVSNYGDRPGLINSVRVDIKGTKKIVLLYSFIQNDGRVWYENYPITVNPSTSQQIEFYYGEVYFFGNIEEYYSRLDFVEQNEFVEPFFDYQEFLKSDCKIVLEVLDYYGNLRYLNLPCEASQFYKQIESTASKDLRKNLIPED
ncbi:hypothetical protein [Marinoscillum luteum]|uniref:Zinc ribbon domain-containing protein n=1 Tax=Marinoscillum luteum TaxID=861051 RepID=A0ABW7NDS4_9BACT